MPTRNGMFPADACGVGPNASANSRVSEHKLKRMKSIPHKTRNSRRHRRFYYNGSGLPARRRWRFPHALEMPMKIAKVETFLTNAGLRNYLFIRLTTDTGLTGLGEASLEWQEKAVQTLLHDWVEERLLGTDPFDGAAGIGGQI